MKFFKILALFSLALIVITFINYVAKDIQKNNETIDVYIVLINECELADEAFMVSSIPENKTAKFENGITRIKLKRSSKVMLSANDKFEGFHYSGIPIKVSERIELIAECDYTGRLDNIFDKLAACFIESFIPSIKIYSIVILRLPVCLDK